MKIKSKDATLSIQRSVAFSKAIAKFNPEKIKMEDLARSGGTPEETE